MVMLRKRDKLKVYRTYAVVVIESIWPRYLDYRGESKQKNLIAKIEKENQEDLKFSTYQDKYLGYYKIIPLNVLNINTSSSKEGNNFSVTFTANKIIFYAEGIIPERLKILLENEPKTKIPLKEYPFLEKVFSGTTQEPEVYITNYNTIANFINELDTVSIYVINTPEKISLNIPDRNLATFIEVFTGANPGRLKQPELESLSNASLKLLHDLGISVNEKQYLKNIETLDQKIFYFRKFSLNSLFKTQNKFNNYEFPLEDKEKTKNKELELLKNTESPVDFINYFGKDIYENYFFMNKDERVKKLKTCINNFYSSSRYKDILSWSAYETFRIRLRDTLGVPSGLCFESKTDDETRKSFTKILDALLIENLLYINAPAVFEKESYQSVEEAIKLVVPKEKIPPVCVDANCINTYAVGVDEFLKVLEKKIKNLGGQHTFIHLPDLNENIKVNFSGDGIGLLMRGHITSINRLLRIAENEADLTISISGKGFEHPLNRTEIVPDLVSLKFAVVPFTNYSVQINTPIDAIRYIIESFAPYRVDIQEIDDQNLYSAIIFSRGFDVYYAPVAHYLINQGNIVAPKFDAKIEELAIFTPLHYASLSLLNYLQHSFDKLAASQKFLANVNKTLSKASVMDNIKNIVGKGSMYKVYIDHLGYLRIEFEPVNIAAPFSLNLNPPIIEENTFSLDINSSEDNVRTFVEVYPSSLGLATPSESGIASIYGRSTAKTIEQMYSSSTSVNIKSVQPEKYINFLKKAISIIDAALKNAIIEQTNEDNKKIENELRKLKSFVNNQSKDKVMDYFKNKTEKQTVSSTYDGQEVVTKKEKDYCTGEVKEYQEVKNVTKNFVGQANLPVKLFKPDILNFIYDVRGINQSYWDSIFYKEELITPIASFNQAFIGMRKLFDLTCKNIDQSAQQILNLPKDVTLCYEENFDLFASLMVLGRTDEVLGNYNNTGSEYGRLVTNFINSTSLRTSFNIFNVSTGVFVKDSKNSMNTDYILDHFAYVLPYTDLTVKGDYIYKNYSPDMFIYGLRTAVFEDAFIAMYDAVKNEDRLSAKRAEVIRSLNSSPINVAKATVYGDVYHVGFTTLVVNENLPPLKGYINEKVLSDINVDSAYLKQEKNLIVYVNEIIETNTFKELYANALPKIYGYNPPSNVTYDTVIEHFRQAIKYILSKSKINNVPTDAYVPLFGVYSSGSLSNPALKGYLDFFVDEPYYRSPSYQPLLSQETDKFIKYIEQYGQYVNEYREYLKPQNYLVAQGHIENVETNWSIGNVFTTTVGLNYLFPALYTYVPLNNRKIILGYVVLNSPLSQFEPSGVIKEFFKDSDWMDILRTQKQDYMNFFKNALGFIKNKAKLIAIEASLDKE